MSGWPELTGLANATVMGAFAEPVTFTPPVAGPDVVPATGGIYDRLHQEIDLAQGVAVSAEAPRVACLADEVPGVDQGWTATIRGLAHRVTDVQPDGTGVVVFLLSDA